MVKHNFITHSRSFLAVCAFAPRALCGYQQRFLGSGAHGNHRKHLPPPPRRLLLLPSLRLLCSSAKSAKIANMARSEEQYYTRITSIQQSLHKR